jgi:KipI family sensor histidine kinase inhibitor
MTDAIVHPCGDTALLVEVADLGQVLDLHETVSHRRDSGDLPGLLELVPAARTLLLVAETPAALPPLRDDLRTLLHRWQAPEPGAPLASHGSVVRIPVRYNGPDLDAVASLTGLSSGEVVAAHTSTPWVVGFGGFAPAPGFSYLVGGDPRLHVPRHQDPRTRVPAGAVGLAGAFSGVYPRPSPGGWQIIGHTEVVLWDVERDPPALLQPGSTVQFVDAETDPEGSLDREGGGMP